MNFDCLYFRVVLWVLIWHMQLEMLNQSDEEIPSFGIFDDGMNKNYIVEDGDVWLSKEDSEDSISYFR